jgi:ABC-type antimicrobial peptide transport system permease subunit
VARRTTEIGIRTALGASTGRIVWMILRDVCLMAVAGLAIGTPLILAGSEIVAGSGEALSEALTH